MNGKIFVWLLATLLLTTAFSAQAQQPKKLPRIGYLAGDPHSPSHEAFRQGLRDLGYVEGQSILIEWRYAGDKADRFPELAAELVRLKVDVVVAANAAAVSSLKRATTTIPIVVASYGGDLVADGIVASFARPGGNITGVTPLDPDLIRDGSQTAPQALRGRTVFSRTETWRMLKTLPLCLCAAALALL